VHVDVFIGAVAFLALLGILALAAALMRHHNKSLRVGGGAARDGRRPR
jgi:hypothetical protein